jgi:hypothetical protein
MGVVKLRVVETLEQTAASINRQFEIAEKENEKGKGARGKERSSANQSRNSSTVRGYSAMAQAQQIMPLESSA